MATTACEQARTALQKLQTKEIDKDKYSKRFFLQPVLMDVLSAQMIDKVLMCNCLRCRTLRESLDSVGIQASDTRQHDILREIPAETTIRLFALLVWIQYPLLIAELVLHGKRDSALDLAASTVSFDSAEDWWPEYHKVAKVESEYAYAELTEWMHQFAVPILTKGRSQYVARRILPFTREKIITNKGAYGTVYEFTIPTYYQKLIDGKPPDYKFARKQMKKDRENGKQTSLRENKNLVDIKILDHPHIVEMYKFYSHGEHFNIIFPRAEDDLDNILQGTSSNFRRAYTGTVEGHPMWKQMQGVLDAFKRLAEGWRKPNPETMEESDYIGFHFDLKPANILIMGKEPNEKWVVSDFGQAYFKWDERSSRRTDTRHPGTWAYLPPEFSMKELKVDLKYDVWSLGCIMVEVLTYILGGSSGVKTFDAARKTDDGHGEDSALHEDDFQSQSQFRSKLKVPVKQFIQGLEHHDKLRTKDAKQFVGAVIGLIFKMLQPNPKDRIDAIEAAAVLGGLLADQKRNVEEVDRQRPQPTKYEHEISIKRPPALSRTDSPLNAVFQFTEGTDPGTPRTSTHLYIFEDQQNWLRLQLTLDDSHQAHTSKEYFFAREDVQFVPVYAFDGDNWPSNGRHFHISPLKEKARQVYPGLDFGVTPNNNDLSRAHAIQSAMTGQEVFGSFTMKSFNVKLKTAENALKNLTRSDYEISEKNGCVQLWREKGDREKKRHYRLVLFGGKEPIMITMRFQTDLVLDEEHPNNESTRVGLHKRPPQNNGGIRSLYVSSISPVGGRKYPGIPLDPVVLSNLEEEKRNRVKFVQAKMEFNNKEDATKLWEKYNRLKEKWSKEPGGG